MSKRSDFFQSLFCNIDSPYFLEKRGFIDQKAHNSNDSQPKQLFFDSLEEFIKDESELEWQKLGYGAFFGVQPRSGRSGRAQDVNTIVTLIADIDFKDFSGGQSEAEDFLSKNLPRYPNWIIHSGHGLHLYWLLREPQALPNDYSNIIHGLAERLHGDAAVKDPSRVLRMPGTWNLKDPKHPVEVKFYGHD